MLSFSAIIKKVEGIDGSYIEIPFNVEEIFGSKRVKVKVKFDDFEYRGSIVNMAGCYLIGMTQEIRKKINKKPGDLVMVVIEKDDEERIVILQKEFKEALESNIKAKQNYEKMSYTNKNKYNTWIESAKKEETKNIRINKAIVMLEENKIL